MVTHSVFEAFQIYTMKGPIVRFTVLSLSLLMTLCATVAAAQATAEAGKSDIDLSKPIVSRGFGQRLSGEQDRPDLEQEFKSGQISYYFGNYREAFSQWEPIAKLGYADAQANLGWLYQAGLGVKQDLGQAKNWYEKAAATGHPVAQNNLGVMYEKGLGVSEDLPRAFHYYQSSAKQGYRFGQYNLAQLLLTGRGTERNLNAAKQWLQKAAAQGVEAASKDLQKVAGQPQGK